MFKKYRLGDYRWITYEDLDATSDYFGRGLRSLGLNPRDKICVFADTRAEWMITVQAAFKHAFPVCTLYTNLGDDAVVHGLNQTQVKTKLFWLKYFEFQFYFAIFKKIGTAQAVSSEVCLILY